MRKLETKKANMLIVGISENGIRTKVIEPITKDKVKRAQIEKTHEYMGWKGPLFSGLIQLKPLSHKTKKHDLFRNYINIGFNATICINFS